MKRRYVLQFQIKKIGDTDFDDDRVELRLSVVDTIYDNSERQRDRDRVKERQKVRERERERESRRLTRGED